ncbi:ATP synthase F1 subunit delta [Candidatus Nomurabacteria bacterium]|nr:ATP synthase F1 subunit delta [Candidatus Nomurabacteria bacterium]
MAVLSNNNIARAIYLASKEEGNKAEFYEKVVRFLAKRKLLSKTADILVRLDKIANDEEKIISAKVSSVEKISEKTKKDITEALSKRYEGRRVAFKENIDEKLLGGFRIEVNDEVIDLTLKNRMKKLQEYLTHSAK